MKNLTNYILKTERLLSLNDYILEKFKINSSNINAKEEDLSDPTGWKEGDILSGTFGYNMTIPIFYKIIKRTAKSFTLQKLAKKLVSGHYNGSFEEIPDENKEAKSKPINARINKYNHVMADRVFLHKWDGKPVWGNDMD